MKKLRIALLMFAAFDFFILGSTAGLLPLTPLAAAQNKPQYPFVSGAPDCILVPPAPFTAIGDSAIYDNRNQGCTTWHLVYNSQGFSALNISFKSADDSGNGAGAFANWGTSGGTLASGTTLPLTATTSGQATGYKYRPFVKISITSVTGSGTIWPILYGYRPGLTDSSGTGAAGAATTTSGTASAVTQAGYPMICDTATSGTVTAGQAQMVRCSTAGILAQVVSAAGADGAGLSTGGYVAGNGSTLHPAVVNYAASSGSNLYFRQYVCDKTAKLNALAAATTQIVPAVASQKIYVCSIIISNNNATATTLKAVEGTGANCATGQADVSALMNIGATSTAPITVSLGANAGWPTATAADALCFTSSAASSLEITISYTQHN